MRSRRLQPLPVDEILKDSDWRRYQQRTGVVHSFDKINLLRQVNSDLKMNAFVSTQQQSASDQLSKIQNWVKVKVPSMTAE